MSGIGGILRVDGAPVEQGLLERMRDIIDFRGPDGSGLWMNGKVGLVHRLLWSTEESVSDQQPMANGRGLWITADCRIDNREELKQRFISAGLWREAGKLFGSKPVPDSAYILFAYELWGKEAPGRLLGDFAFAIWDEPRQKLFCARDQIGIKPFVYHWNGRKFLFGSEMKQIFQDPSVSEELNLLHLADLLATSFPNREETPFLAVRRLPPGHSILIEWGNFRLRRYWDWNPLAEPLSRSSVQENAARFLELFREAVRARIRSPIGYRAGAFLSGGLDSSSVVAAAVSSSPPSQTSRPFPVFTSCFLETDPRYQRRNFDPVDEGPYVAALAEQYPLELHRSKIEGYGPFENLPWNLWFQIGRAHV